MSNYPGKFYVPDTGQCVNGCPTLPGYSVYDSITCQKCYYTCLTCSLPKLNERCDTCDSLVFRTLNTTTNQCDCNSGYVDVAVTICVTCSSIIS
jgi:proprotein convertase subtilisin/kexin type 5